MKTKYSVYTIILVLLPFMGICQKVENPIVPKYKPIMYVPVVTFSAGSGFFARVAEIAKDDYRRIAAKRPNLDPKFGDPKKSFRNKYKNWPTDQSEAFFGSKTVFVWRTDLFHKYNFFSGLLMAGSVGFTLTIGGKNDWKNILLKSTVFYASNRLGRKIADLAYPKID